MPAIGGGVRQVLLLGLLVGCGEKAQPFMPMTLPSGRVVKVQSYLPEHLFTGEEALLLKYVPDARIDDDAALDAEVASLWKEVRQHAQTQQGVNLVLIRAIGPASNGWSEGPQRQYVYRLQQDGTWNMQKDPEVRLR